MPAKNLQLPAKNLQLPAKNLQLPAIFWQSTVLLGLTFLELETPCTHPFGVLIVLRLLYLGNGSQLKILRGRQRVITYLLALAQNAASTN